jgi:hypothetical protein
MGDIFPDGNEDDTVILHLATVDARALFGEDLSER